MNLLQKLNPFRPRITRTLGVFEDSFYRPILTYGSWSNSSVIISNVELDKTTSITARLKTEIDSATINRLRGNIVEFTETKYGFGRIGWYEQELSSANITLKTGKRSLLTYLAPETYNASYQHTPEQVIKGSQ